MPNKTTTMYAHLVPEEYTKGEASSRLRDCLQDGKEPDASLLFNVFEGVAFELFPPLEVYRRAMLDMGADWVHLTGSGPALYTFAASKEKAVALAETLRNAGDEACAATTVGPSGEMLP